MVGLSLSDGQAEALLRGSVGSEVELEAVAGVLAAVRDLAQPDSEADFSYLFAAAARESRVTPIERFATEHITISGERRPQLIQRVAFAGAVFLVLVGMSPGLAYAADGAKPGDLMYGLDMAFEAVGFDNGGAAERLSEVEALIAAGAVAEGLLHATLVLDGHPGSDEAKAALTAAASRLEDAADRAGSQAAPIDDVIDYLQSAAEVSDLIGYLQAALASSAGVDGHAVAVEAQNLGRSRADPVRPPTEPGSRADPVGPPTEPGSQADPVGPSTEPGSQADPVGPPTEPGSQADPVGPPTNPGSQSSERELQEQGRNGK